MSRSDPPRIVVAHAEGPPGHEAARFAVAVVPFFLGGDLVATVVAKLSLSTKDEAGRRFTAEPRAVPPPPLTRGTVGAREVREVREVREEQAAHEAPVGPDAPDDFLPGKPGAEVLLVGHARAAEPTDAFPVQVAVAGADGARVVDTGFVVVAPLPIRDAPMLQVAPPHAPPGPRRVELPDPLAVDAEGDLAAFLSAPSPLRARAPLDPDAVVTLGGVDARGPVRIALPGLHPHVVAEVAAEPHELSMSLDTLFIDTDEGRVDLTFRGHVPVGSQSIASLQQIVVTPELRAAPRTEIRRAADLPRGDVFWAATPEEVAPLTDPGHPRIEAARLDTLAGVAPEPRIAIARFAKVSAQIAESPRDRARALERNGIDAWVWTLEERAWLERFAHEALRGDPTSSAVFGELFVAEQDALARPEEADVTLRDYAAARVAMEHSLDPAETLETLGMTLPSYARVERRWIARAEAEPAVEAELQRHLDELRRAAAAEPA